MRSVEDFTGVIRSAQSRIEMGDTKAPNFFDIAKLAAFYGISLDEISGIVAAQSGISLSEDRAPLLKQVPVQTWDKILLSGKRKESDSYAMVACPFSCSENAFALKVRGDSMRNTSGAPVSFPEGCIVVIDPDVDVQHKDFVAVQLKGAQEAILRQIHLEGGKILLPLNSQFPSFPLYAESDAQIAGVVIGIIQETRSKI